MAEFLEQILEQTITLRAPLAGDSPAGADIALEPEFELIKAEIDKLSNLTGGQVDWRAVIKGAEALLTTRSKDLRLGLWMACGELDRGGWAGFARALVVCRALIVDLWDTLHPARPKARSNIVGWFGERVSPQLAEMKVDLASGDAVRACEAILTEIDAALAEKLGESYGGMGSARNAMRARVRDIPEPPPPVAEGKGDDWAEDDTPAPSTDRTGSVGTSRASVALSSRAEDAADTARKCGEALVLLAKAMRSQEPSRAWAYRLQRTGIWLPFDAPPDTPLPGPSADLRASVSSLFASARWQELLEAAEDASAQAPLWLCAHRFAAIATERLGLSYANAREVIGRDVADLVRRWPTVALGVFEDGTPHATEETRTWLTGEVARWQLVTARGETAAKDADEKLRRRFDDARDLVSRGHHAEGLALGGELTRRAADPRSRFKSGLRLAELAMGVAAYDVARPMLDGLFATAEAHGLETWEPALCGALYSSLVKCLDHEAREGKPGAEDRRAHVFERLCRVDAAAALRSRGGGTVLTNGVRAPAAARVSSPEGQATPTPSEDTSSSATTSGAASTSGSASDASEWADDD